jgi:hypothetical protein
MEWKYTQNELPEEKKYYLVAWANPYEKEMNYAIKYFDGTHFYDSPSGANFIVAWLEIETPIVSKEIRQKLVK